MVHVEDMSKESLENYYQRRFDEGIKKEELESLRWQLQGKQLSIQDDVRCALKIHSCDLKGNIKTEFSENRKYTFAEVMDIRKFEIKTDGEYAWLVRK